jgi:hypothetical protein
MLTRLTSRSCLFVRRTISNFILQLKEDDAEYDELTSFSLDSESNLFAVCHMLFRPRRGWFMWVRVLKLGRRPNPNLRDWSE